MIPSKKNPAAVHTNEVRAMRAMMYAPISVMMTSTIATPPRRIECAPVPGTPRASRYLHNPNLEPRFDIVIYNVLVIKYYTVDVYNI